MMFPFELAHLEETKQILNNSFTKEQCALYSVDASQALFQQSQRPIQEHPSTESAEGKKAAK